jgi:uncharacterized protein YfaS (alpha-2-macroglobulin family)
MEQTSSAAYPNVLVVDYVKKARVASPKLLLKAEQYLNVGYQRLLTFERPGGGFDWWGSGPPLVWLSAYGLLEFSDMARVYPIDRAVIDRTQAWLLKQQDQDGTWSKPGDTHGCDLASLGDPKLILTSYVAWALLESGLPREKLRASVNYIRGKIKDQRHSAYVLALGANALAAYDPKDAALVEVLRRLDRQRKDLSEWRAVSYPSAGQSLTWARGDYLTVETTALTTLAMLKTGQFTSSVNRALTYLIKTKEGNGTWGNTSATILALKALVAGVGGPQIKGRVPFTVLVDGRETARGEITADNADLMQAFDLKPFTRRGPNRVQIRTEHDTGLTYQVVGRYWRPWQEGERDAKRSPLQIAVHYDRTKLATNDLLRATATLRYSGDRLTFMVLVDLGIPPGFTVDAGDFAEMVGKKEIQKFSVTPRIVTLYLGDVRPGDERTFAYTLRARYPIRAQVPGAVAYEYYTPTSRAASEPVRLVVTEPR